MPRKKEKPFRFALDEGDDHQEYTASTEAFKKRIKEILDRARRLVEKEQRGFRYQKIWVGKTKVRAHVRNGYFTYRPMRRKP